MLLFLLIFFALYLFLIFPNLPRRDVRHLQGYDYAHRGLWNATLPENSMAAFRNAVAHGFGMELDVHLTKDDQLVVFHDDSLLRMCGVDKP
ncbi:MAG: glycerophosphodiester phosphodiesterase, partial [Clostridia bacterium]|nr:glycerophosphodiester phosphodiesterase [Clostridia bacterium]